MPFNLLLLSSLKRETKLSDHGHTVFIRPKQDEHILFFDIDNDTSALRAALQERMRQINICDGLIFYQSGSKQILCLVELKGSDIEHAVHQILNTYNFLQELLKESLQSTKVGRSLLSQVTWYAYICQRKRSSAPSMKSNKHKIQKYQHIYKLLENTFTKYKIQKNSDIGTFLRG